MRWLILTILMIFLINDTYAIAKQEKIIKKPLNLKPIKGTKTVLDEFQQHLAPEDAEFIKQIDKQFKAHGDKLTIKFEQDNSTKAYNKNTKRTIEDSLSYSYQQNMHPNAYYFSRPIYMHKFTSRDVPAERGYHNEKATDIEIQQSHSYEIKGENYQYQAAESQHNLRQQQVYEDPVPVIVLRVPGPAKYALHLQALLQQYLELRAAQFLKVLEEQERHGNLMKTPHQQQQPQSQHQQQQHYAQQEQVAYIPMIQLTPTYQSYYQQQAHAHHQQHQQQPQQQHTYRQQYYQQQPIRHETIYMHVPAGEQSYYRQAQVPHHAHAHHHHQQQQIVHKYTPPTAYHNTQVQQPQVHQQPPHHPTTFVTYVTPAYTTAAAAIVHEEHSHEPLQTSENYPSDKHTHVIFKKKKSRPQNHPQPSITYHQAQPQPIIVPDTDEHHYNHQPEPQVQHQEPENVHVTHHEEYSVTHQPIYDNQHGHDEHEEQHQQQQQHHHHHHEDMHVAVTERTKTPYNYHITGPTLAPTREELQERHNPKRMAPFTKEQFEKARRIMDKSKRSRGSTKLEKVMEKSEKKS